MEHGKAAGQPIYRPRRDGRFGWLVTQDQTWVVVLRVRHVTTTQLRHHTFNRSNADVKGGRRWDSYGSGDRWCLQSWHCVKRMWIVISTKDGVNVVFHLGSALIPLLFIIVMEAENKMKENVCLQESLCLDNVVLMAEFIWIPKRLRKWTVAMESERSI